MMESGSFLEAAQVYEQLLKKDPDDEDARTGLRLARLKSIETRLIQVRKERLGEHKQAALDLLLDILNDQLRWKMTPAGAVFSTQKEEIEYSGSHLSKEIQVSIAQEKPLRASYLIAHYELIYNCLPQSRRIGLSSAVARSGIGSCQKMRKQWTLERPYYSQFIQRFCLYYGDQKAFTPGLQNELLKRLFSSLELRSSVRGLDSTDVGHLQANLNKSVLTSPWYDPHAKQKIIANLDGEFKVALDREPTILYHEYKVEEQYVTTEDVTKTRQIPVVENEFIFNPELGRQEWKPVNKLKTESYKETIPVTKTRSVPKSFPYSAWRYTQRLEFKASGTSNLGSYRIPIGVQKSSVDSDTGHDISQPAIDLQPKRVNLENKDCWLTERSDEIATDFGAALEDLWLKSNCSLQNSASHVNDEGETVFRCLRLDSKHIPPRVGSWFQTSFGVTLAQADQVIGILKESRSLSVPAEMR